MNGADWQSVAVVVILLLAVWMVWLSIYITALIRIGSITLLIISTPYVIPAIIVGMRVMINAMTLESPIVLDLQPPQK